MIEINRGVQQFATALVANQPTESETNTFGNIDMQTKMQAKWTEHGGRAFDFKPTIELSVKYLTCIKNLEQLETLQKELTTTKKVINATWNFFKVVLGSVAFAIAILGLVLLSMGGSGMLSSRSDSPKMKTIEADIQSRISTIFISRLETNYQPVIEAELIELQEYEKELKQKFTEINLDLQIAKKIIEETSERLDIIKSSLNSDENSLHVADNYKNAVRVKGNAEAWLHTAEKIFQQNDNGKEMELKMTQLFF